MTHKEFIEDQKQLGLDNAGMALICSVTVRTIERWRAGSVRVPSSAVRLIDVYTYLEEHEYDVWEDLSAMYNPKALEVK